MKKQYSPPEPVHVNGTNKGEEMVLNKGREAGRSKGQKSYRTARDSTGINAKDRDPIIPAMGNIPPA